LSGVGSNACCQAIHHLGIGTSFQWRSRPGRMFLRSRFRYSVADILRRSKSFTPTPSHPLRAQRGTLSFNRFARCVVVGEVVGRFPFLPPLPRQHPIHGLGIGIHTRIGSRPPAITAGGLPIISRTHRSSCFGSPILSVHIVRRRRTSRTRSGRINHLSRVRGTASATSCLSEPSQLATNRTRHISIHATKTKQPRRKREEKV
jgi:hypothetical protein